MTNLTAAKVETQLRAIQRGRPVEQQTALDALLALEPELREQLCAMIAATATIRNAGVLLALEIVCKTLLWQRKQMTP